jgi:isochorismate hydrolase
MKVSELKNKIENKEIEIENIEIKSYIPIVMKEYIIGCMLEAITEDENGMKKISPSINEMLKTKLMFKAYADIDFDEQKAPESYDYLNTSGIYEHINSILKYMNDYRLFSKMIDDAIEQEIETSNSVSAVLSKKTDKLINVVSEKLDELMKKIPDKVDINEMMNKLPSIINKISPNRLKSINNIFGNEAFKKDIQKAEMKNKEIKSKGK